MEGKEGQWGQGEKKGDKLGGGQGLEDKWEGGG